MFKINIPRKKYWVSDYANLENGAEGAVIPLAWGDIHEITPVCIDTAAGKWKLMLREIKAIDAVRADKDSLVSGADFTPDLVNAEFTLPMTPFLAPNTTYYFVIEADYAIDGVNYIGFSQANDFYADGQRFNINGAGVWDGTTGKDLFFEVFGKASMDSAEYKAVENWSYPTWPGDWNRGAYLKQAAANTRIAQSFKTGSEGFYITKIRLNYWKYGAPTGNIMLSILSAYNPAEVQLGSKSQATAISAEEDMRPAWKQRAEVSELRVDIEGRKTGGGSSMTNVADILEDVLTSTREDGGLEIPAGDLDAAAFAALKLARTELLAIYLNSEITFGEFVAKLEAGQLFKFLVGLDGKYTVKYYASGEPTGTPHLRDEDFISFKMSRDWQSVVQKVQVKFGQNPSTQEWQVREESSNIALWLYKKENTLVVETYHSVAANATQLAKDYLGTDLSSTRRQHLQYPPRYLEAEVSSAYGLDQIPADKIKVTRARADYTGGSMSAVLFRILSLEKRANGTCKIFAVLDSQTY